MSLNNYSQLSRLIHKAYLKNYFVSKTSFDLEQMIYGKKAHAKDLKEIVFVTGLARSGTTALFNALYSTGGFASLTYANMPFLLMPNIGRFFSDSPPSDLVERSHQDGIMVNNKSPEAFDEYFWKVFLEDQYIQQDKLHVHQVDKSVVEKYKAYIQSVAYSCNKNSYLSKNNNNILRIASLLKAFPDAKFIVMYRNPLSQAHSLLKQHINFSNLQCQDHFVVEYFNYLGHHEFGLNHKPFYFDEKSKPEGSTMDLNYWLANWGNYYSYLLSNFNERLCLIAFEDLCEDPIKVTNYLNERIGLENPVSISNKFFPKPFPAFEFDKNIYNNCMKIYNELNLKRAYY
jgi:hypothetical protein